MSFVHLTIDQLVKSTKNARINTEDAEAVDALAASILAVGQTSPLIVRKAADGDLWEVLDGGRRRLAIEQLIAAGDVPADWPIECVVRVLGDAEAAELSLAVALLSCALRPYEKDAAVVRAHNAGASVEQIARDLGHPEVWVRQRLRLGRLDPAIFEAYAQGAISTDLAEAYAATEDHALQHAVWTSFAGMGEHSHTPRAVRARMGVGDAAQRRSLEFVGEDAYRAAGGRFELDLFADGPEEVTRWRGRVTDPGLLAGLHEQRMATLRDEVRQAIGRPDLPFLAEPPRDKYHAVEHGLEWRDGLPASNDPASLSAMLEAGIDPPQGLACLVRVIEEGGVELEWYWPSRKARGAAEAATATARAANRPIPGLDPGYPETAGFDRYSGDAQAARAAAKDDWGFTADALEGVRSLRRQMERAALVDDAVRGGDIALAWLVWGLLRAAIAHDRPQATGLRGLVSEWSEGDREPADVVHAVLDGTGADDRWRSALDAVARHPSIAEKDPEAGFAAWLDAPDEVRRPATAVLAGLAMVRSANVPGWRVPVHDMVASLIGASDARLREYWTPDARWLGQLPRLKRLELAQPLVGTAQTTRWSKLRDGPLAEAVADCLAAQPDWVHPALSFGVESLPAGSGLSPDARAELVEAPDAVLPPAGKRRMAREAEPAA